MLKSVADKAAKKTLHRIPTRVWKVLFPKSTVGLCYHVISDTQLPHVKHYPVLTSVEFEADIDALQKKFSFISYEQLLARYNTPDLRRDNAAILTFDDGFSQCAEVVSPTLVRRGLNAIFFVITDLIGNKSVFIETAASLCIHEILKLPSAPLEKLLAQFDFDVPLPSSDRGASKFLRPTLDMAGFNQIVDQRLRALLHWLLTVSPSDADQLEQLSTYLGVDPAAYVRDTEPFMTEQQIRSLHNSGFTIGAHGCSHRLLQKLSKNDAEHEIVTSCRAVQDITGQASVPFAFPYSGSGIERAWLEYIRREHSCVGLFFDTDGMREDAPFVVQRVFGERIGNYQTIDQILRDAWARPSAWRYRS